jgi:phage gp29-like protein
LADSLYSIQNDAAVALANVDEVKVLESRGSSEDFAKLIEVCNAEISKAVTGEILTSDTGSSGSYALAKEHTKTFEAKAAKTASALAAALSGTVVKWLAELNFGHGCKVPSFVFENSENAGWEMIKDAVNLGMNVDLEEAARRFGIPLK